MQEQQGTAHRPRGSKVHLQCSTPACIFNDGDVLWATHRQSADYLSGDCLITGIYQYRLIQTVNLIEMLDQLTGGLALVIEGYYNRYQWSLTDG